MKKRVVFMYSGQGSQFYQMGNALYRENAVFKQAADDVSDSLASLLGCSLAELVYRDRANKHEPFDDTRFTHPAIYMVQHAMTAMLRDSGIEPDLVLGYSMGEIGASLAAGALDVETGARLAAQQGAATAAHTPEATMMAVLAAPNTFSIQSQCFAGTWLACRNYNQHFVVTGKRADLERIQNTLQQQKIITQLLPIQVGFHSPLIDPAASSFLEAAGDSQFKTPHIPIYSSRIADRLETVDAGVLWRAIRERVQFLETVRRLEDEGPLAYVDMGPAGTMTAFIRQILGRSGSGSTTFNTITPFGLDKRSMDALKQMA